MVAVVVVICIQSALLGPIGAVDSNSVRWLIMIMIAGQTSSQVQFVVVVVQVVVVVVGAAHSIRWQHPAVLFAEFGRRQ